MCGQALPTREQSWDLLLSYTTKPFLIQHAQCVEAACQAYAEKLGGDANTWGQVGLLHDFDYERWPSTEDHPFRGEEILRGLGYPDAFRRAIVSHANYSGVSRDSDLEKVLFACDELSGFLVACALVQPTKSVRDVKVKSVIKRLKAKRFAAGVDRDDVHQGAVALGVELQDHIATLLNAFSAKAEELGLGGVVQTVADSSSEEPAS